MTLDAALSIWSLVVVELMSRVLVVWVACCMRSDVASLPSRYWSIKFCGMGRRNGGWLLVVGFCSFRSDLWDWMSPICGRSRASAIWSPYSGVCVVMFVLCGVYGCECVGCSISQWSMCVLAGMYVYVCEGLRCMRPVESQNLVSGG